MRHVGELFDWVLTTSLNYSIKQNANDPFTLGK